VEIKELWKLPVSSEESISKLQFIKASCSPLLEEGIWKLYTIQILFDYYKEKKEYHNKMLFDAHQVYKFTSEQFAKPLTGSLNTLVECTNSEWLNKLIKINPEVALSDFWRIRHFAIFFNGYGLYEIFAHDYKILETKEGPLRE
jgi:hypothetical protein